MIQDCNHLWNPSVPLPLVTPPANGPAAAAEKTDGSPAAGCPNAPGATAGTKPAEDIAEEFQWLSLL
jgi:hypothetical protein